MKSLFVFLLLVSGVQAQQCTTLLYQGTPFNSLTTTGPNYSQIVPLAGTVTLSAPLPANLVNAPISPIAWSFAAEDPQFNSANGFYLLQSTFVFSTDDEGTITNWSISVSSQDASATAERNNLNATSTPSGDSVSSSHNNVGTPLAPTSIAGTSNTAGTWACQPPPAVNPLAAPLAAAQAQVVALTAQVASLQAQLAAAQATPATAVVAATPVMVAGTKTSGGGAVSWISLLGLAGIATRRAIH